MKIESVESFLTVVNKGSMSEAAESLFTTPQNMSFILKNLEAELGVDLLVRTNKGVVLTEEGKKFLPYATNIVSVFRDYQLSRMVDINMEKKALQLFTTVAIGQYLGELSELEMPQNQQISMITVSVDEIYQHLRNNIPGLYLVPISRENMPEFKKWKNIILGKIQDIDVYVDKDNLLSPQSTDGKDLVGLTCADTWTKRLVGLWNGTTVSVGNMDQAKRMMKRPGYVYLVPDLFEEILFPKEQAQWEKRYRIKMQSVYELILISNLPEHNEFEFIREKLEQMLLSKEK